nr:methyltransferase [Pseudenhygromyxa sp. WMMC2535]
MVALPRRPDPRFDYRVAHLPASSHPTLAAIMARVAAPQPGERVWDPFCGCAAELIECSRLADALRLIGTDRDPQAIAAARANVEAAGLDPARVRIEEVDVYAGSPAKADVILTNPPMGRRTALAGGLHASLRRFVSHAARTLSPGGRLVWVTPAAQVTAAAGAAAGLRVRDHGSIDMSGMRVVLQEMRR